VLKKYICLTLFFVFFYPHTDKHLAVLSQRTSKTVNTHILTLWWMVCGTIRYLFDLVGAVVPEEIFERVSDKCQEIAKAHMGLFCSGELQTHKKIVWKINP
jgi:hypothetical protein